MRVTVRYKGRRYGNGSHTNPTEMAVTWDETTVNVDIRYHLAFGRSGNSLRFVDGPHGWYDASDPQVEGTRLELTRKEAADLAEVLTHALASPPSAGVTGDLRKLK